MTRTVPPGTQSIVRTVELLKALGARRQIGWRLTDLAAHCGLTTSTAYRIMTCLTALRLARQRPRDKRYVPGPALYELALNVPSGARFQGACRASLTAVAEETGWVAFLALRSGEDTVCIDRVGRTSVNIMNEVGRRLPMAGSSLGVAILLALPVRERSRVLAANRRALRSNAAHRERTYDQMWRESRRRGIGINLGDILPGGASMSVAIRDGEGRPLAAIGVAGPLAEFTESRIGAVKQMLVEAATRIERDHAALVAELAWA
ncbi:MAG: IclR family transcriptional regulator [Burkholderiales bacterium]|nr:IclR family transcriptional regulator [Burkholderiales bacterium]